MYETNGGSKKVMGQWFYHPSDAKTVIRRLVRSASGDGANEDEDRCSEDDEGDDDHADQNEDGSDWEANKSDRRLRKQEADRFYFHPLEIFLSNQHGTQSVMDVVGKLKVHFFPLHLEDSKDQETHHNKSRKKEEGKEAASEDEDEEEEEEEKKDEEEDDQLSAEFEKEVLALSYAYIERKAWKHRTEPTKHFFCSKFYTAERLELSLLSTELVQALRVQQATPALRVAISKISSNAAEPPHRQSPITASIVSEWEQAGDDSTQEKPDVSSNKSPFSSSSSSSSSSTKPQKQLRTLDIFCGCGGLSLGLSEAGLDVKWAVDLNIFALHTLQSSHPSVKVFFPFSSPLLLTLLLISNGRPFACQRKTSSSICKQDPRSFRVPVKWTCSAEVHRVRATPA